MKPYWFNVESALVAMLAFGLCARAIAAPSAPPTVTASTGEVSYAELPAHRPSHATNIPAASETTAPATPRELFNAGTQQLRGGKLREAEASLETALASQKPALQPVALYNLGHVRFG